MIFAVIGYLVIGAIIVAGAFPSGLGRLQEAIIVNWKGGIIVAVGLFFIGGLLGLWLMMRATSEIRAVKSEV